MQICNRPFILLQETNSTNSYLKELNCTKQLKEGTVVQTLFQTAGRGQAGNYWESEQGKNLTFSLILYPAQIPVSNQFLLSQIVSLAIYDVLSEEASGISIKWPNDIYYKDSKICGILIEQEITGTEISSSIIGIGVNVNQMEFKSNAPNPISLQQITGKSYELFPLLERIIARILQLYEHEEAFHIISRYKKCLYHRDGFYSFRDKDGIFSATIIDVEDKGSLVLETSAGERRQYLFKEVSFIHQNKSNTNCV